MAERNSKGQYIMYLLKNNELSIHEPSISETKSGFVTKGPIGGIPTAIKVFADAVLDEFEDIKTWSSSGKGQEWAVQHESYIRERLGVAIRLRHEDSQEAYRGLACMRAPTSRSWRPLIEIIRGTLVCVGCKVLSLDTFMQHRKLD